MKDTTIHKPQELPGMEINPAAGTLSVIDPADPVLYLPPIDLDAIVMVDGQPTDPDTGERYELPQLAAEATIDQRHAEWLVEAIYDVEREADAVGAKLATVTEQLQRRQAQLANRAAAMRYVFGPALEQWAKANLPKGKKSVVLTCGTLKFASHGDKVQMVGKGAEAERAAIAAVKAVAPSAVQVKQVESLAVTKAEADELFRLRDVLDTAAPEHKAAVAELTDEQLLALMAAFKFTPAGETFTVDTRPKAKADSNA